MYFPKVNFKLVPIELEIRMFKRFINHRFKSFSDKFFIVYPEISDKSLDLEKFLTKKWSETKDKAKYNATVYQQEWNKIENEFMTNLSEIIATDWFTTSKTMKAYLSLCALFPRFIEDMSFFIPCDGDKEKVCRIAAHEITHFLYFKKFKELFPTVSEKKYNGSTVEWILSEILAPIILNDKRLEKLFIKKNYGYDIFYKSKIGNKTIMLIFEEKYAQMIEKDKKKFDSYLKWAYKYAKEHEKELMVMV